MITWRKLESEFKELGKQMTYTRLDVQWGAAGEYWRLAGNFDRNTDKRFTALSSIAGQQLASFLDPGVEIENELLREPDHIIRWYKGIWKISQNFEFGFIGEQTHNDGTSAGHIYTGTINKIADAAATFCLELAARYPEAEEDKKITSPSPSLALQNNNLNQSTVTKTPDETAVDRFIKKAKNNPLLSIFIFIGIVVIGLANFTDAIKKLIAPFPQMQKESVIQHPGKGSAQLQKKSHNEESSGKYGISNDMYDKVFEITSGQTRVIEAMVRQLNEKDKTIKERDEKIAMLASHYAELKREYETKIHDKDLSAKDRDNLAVAKKKLDAGDLAGAKRILKPTPPTNLQVR